MGRSLFFCTWADHFSLADHFHGWGEVIKSTQVSHSVLLTVI